MHAARIEEVVLGVATESFPGAFQIGLQLLGLGDVVDLDEMFLGSGSKILLNFHYF